MLGWAQWLALLVAAQRLGELAYARHNESRLRARGAVERGARHYPLFILLHGAWLLAVFLLIPADQVPSWPLLALFLLLQLARVWVVATLGPYWTTRVLSLPGAPLVRRGPYRWVRHPNYLIVAAEIAVLPLAFDAWTIAIAFSLANALLLRHRIGVEENALAGRS
ncbi:isoprenylcysteine carboxyl methyltransferase family protein [Inquilinus sp. Marseille-Q2685]|uniref:isoprenylcysteine carboxyl methyltransferase family protein n=1 Tax=Inquilinus sp. Marseille-Q2685 TaxID=2866581 RepID=UPI001CE3CFB4|nr:isoprenylcysteine carboxylmethyltransferase family protein [Inquilinus sp. Marseille-Q2685]